MSVCLYTMCILDTQEGQKRVLDFQERELEIAESYHVRARNWTWVPRNNIQCF